VLGLINVYVKEGHMRRSGEEAFLTSVANTLAGIIQHSRTEHEKEHLQAQLAQSEKLAALGRFTANVAHEIRNPLTAVGGFARRLDKSIAEGTKEKDYAGFIITEVNRLEGILKNVLTFSRDATPQMEECDISETIDRVLKMNEEICREKSISIQKSYNDVPLILIDNAQLHEAVENLVLNAVDAMEEGGVLTVSLGKELHEGGLYIYLKIKDSGVGISPDKLSLIFEPFFTTKVAEKGTGLGLPITKKILEDHGGFIRVESTIGEGTEFSLYFPLNLT
jgi:signal transduction histidine kinase